MACNLIINMQGIGDIIIPNISITKGGELTKEDLLTQLKSLPQLEINLINSIISREVSRKENLSKLKSTTIKREIFKGQMTYEYGENKRSDVLASNTLDAIKSGERTATTRYENDGNIDYWKSVKEGDIIEWKGSKGNSVQVQVTKPLTKLRKNTSSENWSKKEGWSVDYFKTNVLPNIAGAWQMEFKVIDTKIPEASNTSLKEKSVKEIYREDITLRDRLFGGKLEVTTKEMLKTISESSSPLSVLAKAILEKTKDKYLNRSIYLTMGEVGENGKYEGKKGEYISGQVTIYENAQFKNGQAERTILHEIIHSVTSDSVYKAKDTQLGKDLNKIFEYARDHRLRDLYGFTNTHEFIAEVFTNSELIVDLQKVKPIEGFTQYKNFFQQVVDNILKLVGFSKSDNLYTQASSLISNLIVDESYRTNKSQVLNRDELIKKYGKDVIENKPLTVGSTDSDLYELFGKIKERDYEEYAEYSPAFESEEDYNNYLHDYNKRKEDYNKYSKGDFNPITGEEYPEQAPFSKSTLYYEKSRDSKEKIVDLVNRLKDVYGVNIEVLPAEEISLQFKGIFKEDPAIHRAFIYEGKVYVNADLASTAEPLHEMAHIILGTIKSSNLELYNTIVSSIKTHPEYENISRSYKERSGSDLDEEVFCTIFAEQYRETKRKKKWNEWYDSNLNLFQNIINFIKNKFSSVFGNTSLLSLSDDDFINMSLDDLIERFGDDLMGGKFKNYIVEDVSVMERKVKNLKSKLIEEGILKSNCE